MIVEGMGQEAVLVIWALSIHRVENEHVEWSLSEKGVEVPSAE